MKTLYILITYLSFLESYKAVTTGYRRLQKNAPCNRGESFVTVQQLQKIISYKQVLTNDTAAPIKKLTTFVTASRLQLQPLQILAFNLTNYFCNPCNRKKRVYLKNGNYQPCF